MFLRKVAITKCAQLSLSVCFGSISLYSFIGVILKTQLLDYI